MAYVDREMFMLIQCKTDAAMHDIATRKTLYATTIPLYIRHTDSSTVPTILTNDNAYMLARLDDGNTLGMLTCYIMPRSSTGYGNVGYAMLLVQSANGQSHTIAFQMLDIATAYTVMQRTLTFTPNIRTDLATILINYPDLSLAQYQVEYIKDAALAINTRNDFWEHKDIVIIRQLLINTNSNAIENAYDTCEYNCINLNGIKNVYVNAEGGL